MARKQQIRLKVIPKPDLANAKNVGLTLIDDPLFDC
jgi:hypothetical protein